MIIRPERLEILTEPPDPEMNVPEARMAGVIHRGDTDLPRGELYDGQKVRVRGIASRKTLSALPEAGAPIRLGIAREDTVPLEA